jgi:16S rRNA (guanine(966)-N(2))-methyltransferase RsmD
VLDLFAGSGAGGIEALSRRAARAVFVERDDRATRTIAENMQKARVGERGTVHRGDVVAYLNDRAAADGPFDLVLLDPPYAETALMTAALSRLGAAPGGAPILTRDATVVAKHFWRDAQPEAVGLLTSVRTRRFGETALTFYRRADRELEDAEASDG